MNEIINTLRDLIKSEDIITIDNTIFRLHYKGGVAFLLFSFILTSKQHFGEPIYCLGEERGNIDAINSYCWIHSTFTVFKRNSAVVGLEAAHPGVGPKNEGDHIIQHKYYQWICYILFFQALLFYTPRFLWLMWEGGRIRHLSLDLGSPILTDKWNIKRKQELMQYIFMNLGDHNIFMLRFIFCEILNFVNIIFQFIVLNMILNNKFTYYGIQVLQTQNSKYDFVDEVFPKVTKCTFFTFGSTGSLQNRELACVLPLNVIHEKFFIFSWWWLTFLGLLSFFALIYRAATLFISRLRLLTMHARARQLSYNAIRQAAEFLHSGDWFFLELLSHNVHPIIMKDIYTELASHFGRESKLNIKKKHKQISIYKI